MDEHLFLTIYRWFLAAILGFFAFIPAWVFVQIVITLYEQPSKIDWFAFVALAVSGTLAYFLGLLTRRAFAGKGRKKDGELLPPWVMLWFIHVFGVLAALVTVLGFYKGEWQPVLGGISYLSFAYGALAYRKFHHAEDDVDA